KRLSSHGMHRDHQRWYSHRLNRDMGVAIYGNYGGPILAFPTSCGDEWEMEGQGMIRTLAPYIDQGRIRIFCINGVQSDSFANKGAHPFHRSWMQAQYDDYVANQSDPWFLHQYASCDIRLVTGCGPWENSGPTYRMSEILRIRGIAHHLDDWGPEGGHEWPYWHHQMWEYVGAHY